MVEEEDKGGCCRVEGRPPPRSPRTVALVAPRLDLGRDEERARKGFVGFINPRSLMDRLPNKGSAQQATLQTALKLMGRPKFLKQQTRRVIQSPTERPGLGGTAPASDSSAPLRPERLLWSPARL